MLTGITDNSSKAAPLFVKLRKIFFNFWKVTVTIISSFLLMKAK